MAGDRRRRLHLRPAGVYASPFRLPSISRQPPRAGKPIGSRIGARSSRRDRIVARMNSGTVLEGGRNGDFRRTAIALTDGLDGFEQAYMGTAPDDCGTMRLVAPAGGRPARPFPG